MPESDKIPYLRFGEQISARMVEGEQAATEKRQPPAWNFIDPATLHGLQIPERNYIVQDWLGTGHVTINYGDGGVGKTLLAQQLMTSAATAKPWCGQPVTCCRSIGLFCEDDEDELHRRQHEINANYDINFTNLQNMCWASGVGEDNTLVKFDRDGLTIATPGLDALLKTAREFEARLVVIDTAADTFGGNENVRREVRKFVGEHLGRLARELRAAVVLNAHPSRTGMSKHGDVDGGSTAWSNTARARWSLTRPADEGVTEIDMNERILTRRKSNYSSIGDTIRLRWQSGVLVPIVAPAGLAGMRASAAADATFMELLAKVTAEGRHVSHSAQSSNYAGKVFAHRPDRNGFAKRDFKAAMERLFASGEIRAEEYGRPNDRGRPSRIVTVKGGAIA